MMKLHALLMDMAALGKAFEIMWKGCLAIAIVIAIVIGVTMLVNKICVNVENKADKKDDNE